jgi:outer membrane lipoprotein-sorting protein
MNRLVLGALAPIALVAASAPAQAPSAGLAAVSAHLKAVTTMTANFTQTDRSGRTLSGVLTLKRPGKIRFQYQQGVPLLVVADGKSLNVIDYQVAQVSRWPIGNSPLSVLLDAEQDLARFAKVIDSGDPRVLLVSARDPKRPEFGTITIAFARIASAPQGLMLQGWTVLDAQNNRSTIKLSNQRFNGAISDQAFRWRDPRPKAPPSR